MEITTTPTVSQSTEHAAKAAAAALEFGRLVGENNATLSKLDDVTSKLAGGAILSVTGIKFPGKERALRTVVLGLLKSNPEESDKIMAATKAVIESIKNDTTGNYDGLIEMVTGGKTAVNAVPPANPPEPAHPEASPLPGSQSEEVPSEPVVADPAAEPKKRRTKKASSEVVPVGMEIAKLNVKPQEPVPPAAVNPADPMSGMIAAVGNALVPVIERIASNRARAEIGDAVSGPIESITNAVRFVAMDSKQSGSKVSAEAVREIVTNELSGEAGKGIKQIIEAGGVNILSGLLDKASDALIAAGPKHDPSKSKLMAEVPKEDPHYNWDDSLLAAVNLIDKLATIQPQNTLVVGPTGSGKTDFVEQFAAKTKRRLIKMDCANLREPREWFGIKGASSGATYFRKSQFWHAVAEGGCAILLDEFNRAPDNIRNPLMPLFDHTRRSYVEELGEELGVGPGTCFFATQNEGLEYTGTHATDRAMKSRFVRRIEIDYLPEAKEISVLRNKTGILEDDAKKLVEIANTIRQKASAMSGGLSDTVSTRQLIQAALDFVIGGVSTFKYTIFSHFSTDGGTNSDRAQVVNMFQLKGFKL